MSIESQALSISEKQQWLDSHIAPIKATTMERLIKIKSILNRVFGEDHNQIVPIDRLSSIDRRLNNEESLYHFKKDVMEIFKKDNYYIIIHTPHVTITNEQGLSHNIEDIYVKIYLDGYAKSCTLSGNWIEGVRATITMSELMSRYAHSHISGLCTSFTLFCLGSGPISQSFLVNNDKFDEIEFEILMYHIKVLLETESVSGNPYNYIKNIGGGKDISPLELDRPIDSDNLSLRTLLEAMYRIIIHKAPNIIDSIRLTVENNRIKVLSTEEFETILRTTILNALNMENRPVILGWFSSKWLQCYKKSNGSYCYDLTSSLGTQLEGKIVLNFKGEDKKFTIKDDPNLGSRNTKYYVHPDISKYICSKLSDHLTEEAFYIYAEGRAEISTQRSTSPTGTDHMALSASVGR